MKMMYEGRIFFAEESEVFVKVPPSWHSPRATRSQTGLAKHTIEDNRIIKGESVHEVTSKEPSPIEEVTPSAASLTRCEGKGAILSLKNKRKH